MLFRCPVPFEPCQATQGRRRGEGLRWELAVPGPYGDRGLPSLREAAQMRLRGTPQPSPSSNHNDRNLLNLAITDPNSTPTGEPEAPNTL